MSTIHSTSSSPKCVPSQDTKEISGRLEVIESYLKRYADSNNPALLAQVEKHATAIAGVAATISLWARDRRLDAAVPTAADGGV